MQNIGLYVKKMWVRVFYY